MPNIITHHYFAEDVLKNSKKDIINDFISEKDFYYLFTQSFDPFFVYEILPFREKLGYFLHDNYIDTFFINYIKIMKKEKLEKNSAVLAALYGHLTHYVLDSITHPYIIYECGEYNKNKPETYKYVGVHTQMEVEIDAYLYETRENKSFKNLKFHQVNPKKKLNKNILKLLNKIYEETFNVKNGGIKYQKALNISYFGLKYITNDKHGRKKSLYQKIDKIIPNKGRKFETFSYYVTSIDKSIFNLEHHLWYNPCDKTIKSTESFFELYDKAISVCVTLFEATKKYINEEIGLKEYQEILKDNSYVTGLSWHKKDELQYFAF